ncbi:hypothetical protein M9H77_14122 [Catharanthus roseus]|uniref:Uncharacterized protein n=1 Tax=Catharanthus roseus TaxID=4058 RepID=A0ACC0BMA5_CATRO|nr:hypothetical protein M9H77_14122 [Catharanthus roseus]
MPSPLLELSPRHPHPHHALRPKCIGRHMARAPIIIHALAVVRINRGRSSKYVRNAMLTSQFPGEAVTVNLLSANCYYSFTSRDRNGRAALFDGIEEGGIRASSSYSSHEIDEHENERAVDGLQDRVNLLKMISGDIHEEVENHNRMLDRMGNDMDSSRGILAGTMDKFKMVFETKSSRKMFTLVASFVVIFLVVYYLTR